MGRSDLRARRIIAFCAIVLGSAIGLASNALFAAETAAQNWPQWRGPTCDGVSTTAHPPTEWSEEKNIKWKVKIPGTGSATPIVWGDKVFIETAIATRLKPEIPVETKEEPQPAAQPQGRRGGRGGFGQKPTKVYQWVFYCLDRKTGKELWKKVVREEVPHEGVMADAGNYAACSPVTDGDHVYAFFGSRGLYCFDMNGIQVWDKDLGKMQIKLGFGEGCSPALYDNKLIVNWDHEGDSFIAAFDKLTGNELWRTPRNETTTWGTPLVVPFQGQTQVIVPSSGKIRSYDLADGKQIWECGGLTANSIPSPVAADGIVYLTTGYQGPVLLAIRLGHTGDLTGTDAIAWKYGKDTPYVPSPLLYNSKLYFFKFYNNVLTCLDAKTGSPVFPAERVEGLGDVYASPVGADGRIYLIGRKGSSVVIREGNNLDVLTTNKLDDRFDASPAVAGNEIFLRGYENVYCISEK
jgi:outer membrane protein assembly factor BamB